MPSNDSADWTNTVTVYEQGGTPANIGGAAPANNSAFDGTDTPFLAAPYYFGPTTTATTITAVSITCTLSVWAWNSTSDFVVDYQVRDQANAITIFGVEVMVPSGTTTGQPPFATQSVTFPGGFTLAVASSANGVFRAILNGLHGPTTSVSTRVNTVVAYNDPTI